MPTPTLSKQEVTDRLFAAFRDHGYEGATLTVLSKATGLGRSTLYYYFPGGKDEMVAAVLNRAHDWIEQFVMNAVDAEGTPAERLAGILGRLDTLYAGGKQACVLGHLALGSAQKTFGAMIQDDFNLWVSAFEALSVESGFSKRVARQKAEDAVAALQGALVMSIALEDTSIFGRAMKTMTKILL